MDEKKSERIEVRLGYSEKQDFVEACDTQGDTPSSALRRFIAGYTKRADGELMGEASRRFFRRYGVGAAVGLVGLALAGLALSGNFSSNSDPGLIDRTDIPALSAALEEAADRPQEDGRLRGQAALDAAKAAGPQLIPDIDFVRFRRFDMDKNGVLTRGEILPSDHHLHRLLDIDGVAGISPDEFYAKGSMHYKLAESWDMKQDGPSQRLAHTGASDTIAVEFDLSQSPPLIHAARPLEDAVIARPDRTVIWSMDKQKPFLVFSNDTHPVRKSDTSKKKPAPD